MSSRLMLQVLLTLSLMLNAFVLAGFVYRSWIVPPPFERQMPPPPPPQQGQAPPRPSVLEMVTRDLDLDDRQLTSLKGVFEQYANVRRDRLRDIQKLREMLAAEYRRPTVDMARVDMLIDQLTRARAEQQKETLRSFAQLEAQLRPDQRERMHQILADRLAQPFYGPRPPGQPGPGPAPAADQGRPPPR
jgi:Spy/CpxP family protein refolding chaperone